MYKQFTNGQQVTYVPDHGPEVTVTFIEYIHGKCAINMNGVIVVVDCERLK